MLVGNDGLSRYDTVGDQPTVRATGKPGLGLVTILGVARDPAYDLPISCGDFITFTREKEACGNGLANPLRQVIVAEEQFLLDPINAMEMPA